MTSPRPALREPGAILLLSCYELGHQPFGLASPAGLLRQRGYAPRLIDLAVERLDAEATRRAAFVGICVPMHTALALGVRAARQVRGLNPACHVCFYGLYASLNEEHLLAGVAHSVVGGEFELPLAEWIDSLDHGSGEPPEGVSLPGRRRPPRIGRSPWSAPSREGLPPLSRYAHFLEGKETLPAGYVESTRGCRHRCLHCPIPPVYGGRIVAIPRETVLADIATLVTLGARHITFGDPDFLNAPGHTLPLAREMHARHPGLTFDFTAKVSHLLRHRDRLAELAALGCRFVVSALESLSDAVLANLDKGHTRADVEAVLALTRAAGIALRPSLLPFTPWSTLEDYLELLDFLQREGLIRHVDPIQLAIRLLVPPGSSLLETPQFAPHRGELDHERFTWRWSHPDPRMDRLQEQVSAIVEEGAEAGEAPEETFARVHRAALEASGRTDPAVTLAACLPVPATSAVPRLSEPWFC